MASAFDILTADEKAIFDRMTQLVERVQATKKPTKEDAEFIRNHSSTLVDIIIKASIAKLNIQYDVPLEELMALFGVLKTIATMAGASQYDDFRKTSEMEAMLFEGKLNG